MGFFLSFSGIIDASSNSVQEALSQYALEHGGSFRPKSGTPRDSHILVLDSLAGNVTVVFPGEFFEWDDASMWLSSWLERPVFSFHIT
jgi:hypothetical protein